VIAVRLRVPHPASMLIRPRWAREARKSILTGGASGLPRRHSSPPPRATVISARPRGPLVRRGLGRRRSVRVLTWRELEDARW